jgi:hypothetical protein
MSINARAKDAGTTILGVVVMLGLIAIPVALLMGAAEFSVWALNWTPTAFAISFFVTILLLVPMALIPPTRGYAAVGFSGVSYVFGAILWLAAMAFTYITWGLFAVIVGLMLFGVGVVPVGMLAALIQGEWSTLGTFGAMLVLTYGCRILGAWLAQVADERAVRLADARMGFQETPARLTRPADLPTSDEIVSKASTYCPLPLRERVGRGVRRVATGSGAPAPLSTAARQQTAKPPYLSHEGREGRCRNPFSYIAARA